MDTRSLIPENAAWLKKKNNNKRTNRIMYTYILYYCIPTCKYLLYDITNLHYDTCLVIKYIYFFFP